ncbi:exported hypothetical protein [Candidatus Zixiibacteriota bacterium]|nr:exported hypothetical protein [candidate division Zixibacteria bacterium]
MRTISKISFFLAISALVLSFPLSGAQASNLKNLTRAERHQLQIIPPMSPSDPIFEVDGNLFKAALAGDLKISETVSPARFNQYSSSSVRLSGGQFILFWQDDRLGSLKIFAQLFDSTGSALSGNRMMIGRSDGYDVIEPKAASDGSGGFFLAWRDIATGRIYAARFSSNLTQTVTTFAVNDTISANFAGPFDLDSYSDGRLVVAWEEYAGANNIALRIFSPAGAALTSTLRVNSDSTICSRWVPSLAVNKGGGMAVVWEDYRNGNADIFMRVLNQDGSPVGNDFGVVQAAFDDSAQYLPQIAYSALDGFAVTWLDRRSGTQKVYLQRYTTAGGLVGSNINISGTDSAVEDWDISTAVNSANNLVASWAEIGESDRIIIQRFGPSFALNGAPITVNQPSAGGRWETSIAIGISDNIISGWTDYRAGNPDIYLQMLTSSGNLIFTNDKIVNDDTQGAPSTNPDIAYLDDNRSAVVFSSRRSDDGDIYLQMQNSAGSPIGNNFKINTDTLSALQDEPSLAVSGQKILTVWNDARAVAGVTGQRIFARFGTTTGTFPNSDFAVSDPGIISSKNIPRAAMARNQSALVAWIDFRNGTGQIWGRMISDPGNLIGTEFKISGSSDLDNDDLCIGRDSSDVFSIVWLSRGFAGGPAAIVSRYSAAGAFLTRFTYNGNMPGTVMTALSTAVNDSGDVYLLWAGVSSSTHLYLTVLSKSGAVRLAATEVPGVQNVNPQQPDIAVDNNRKIMASWIDSRSGKRIAYYQIYNSNFIPAGANIPVSATAVEFMQTPTVSSYRDRGWVAWVDPRQYGLNVYSNSILYAATEADDNKSTELPSQFALDQNYPNPFNPATTIEFSVPSKSLVKIEIIDILGRTTAVVADAEFPSGKYRVVWNGRDSAGHMAASGIYFYRLSSGGFSATRKMILLK